MNFFNAQIIIPSFAIAILLFLSSIAHGQTYGCHVVVGMSDRLYYTPYGLGSPTEWQTVVNGSVSSSGETGGFRSDGSASFGCILDQGSSCTVYQQYQMSPGVIGMRIYRTGVYASIAIVNCPIDDGLVYFALLVCIISYLYIRNSNFI